MAMKNPLHPGLLLRDTLEEVGMSQGMAADMLGVSRKHLGGIVRGNVGISSEMALRISVVFGSSAESWLNMQMNYDLSRAKERIKPESKRLVEAHKRFLEFCG